MGKRNLKQHYAIKFCMKLKQNAAETYGKIKKAFVDDSLSRAQIFR